MSKQDNRTTTIEQSLIRLLIDKIHRIYDVDEEFFITELGRNIFKSIEALVHSNTDVTINTLTIELNTRDEVHKNRIEALFNLPVPTESFEILYSLLKKESAKVFISKKILNEMMDDTSSSTELDVSKVRDYLKEVEKKLNEVEEKSILVYKPYEMIEEYERKIYERDTGKAYYDTGCHWLNKKLVDGFAPKRITTIFGTSGVGKSSFALYLVNRQINKSIPCMYVSLEMDLVSTMDRLIAQRNNIPIEMFHSHLNEHGPQSSSGIPDYVFNILETEKKKLGQSPFFRFVEEPGLSLKDLEYFCRTFMKETKQNYMILTVDLMSMVRDFNMSGMGKAQSYEDAMNTLHEVVKRNNIHCVGVFQSRRPSNRVNVDDIPDLERFKPSIEEIKNSAAIEERSRIIMSTFRIKHFAVRAFGEDDPRVATMDDIMNVSIMKNNLGRLGSVDYTFIPETSRLIKLMSDEEIDAVSN